MTVFVPYVEVQSDNMPNNADISLHTTNLANSEGRRELEVETMLCPVGLNT